MLYYFGSDTLEDGRAGDTFLRIHPANIVKMQVEGADLDGFRPVQEGSEILLQFLDSVMTPDTVSVCITHDVIIAAFLGYHIGYVPDIKDWIGYLQGFYLVRSGEGFLAYIDESVLQPVETKQPLQIFR